MGHVGSGKSSLVQALLGEMQKVAGTVSLKVSRPSFSVLLCIAVFQIFVASDLSIIC